MKLINNKTRVLILTHYNYRTEHNEDTDERIINYLKLKVKKIILITQPFPEFGQRYSYILTYENGKKTKESKYYILNGPSIFQFLHHVLLIYYLLFKNGVNFDLCISMENLSTVSIYPLRLLKTIKRLVYYSIDFVPSRFPSPILNNIYRFMDKFACKYSDNNWVMTEQQLLERKRFGIVPSNSSPFTIVPIGYDNKKINIKSVDKIDLYNLIYVGAMRESTGPELAIKTIPLLIKKFPKIKLTMIGPGKDTDKLKKLIRDLKIGKYINFLGYVANFWDLVEIISKKSIGLAPYKPMPDSFSFYSDPSKIKLYMSCGLPVITTDMTTMSNLIAKTHSGVIIDYSEESLCNGVAKMLSNKNNYQLYKKAAIKLSPRFDINHILNNAIEKIPN